MSTNARPERKPEVSPSFKARIAGFFYLLTFVTGIPGVVVLRRLVVESDAAATASNILAHKNFFQLGFAAFTINVACYLAVTGLLYDLFGPVNRTLSLIAALFSLVGCAVQALACAFFLTPLVLLGHSLFLSGVNQVQLEAGAQVFLKLHALAYNVGIVFFGFYCLLIGCLVIRSTFLPRTVGWLMAFGGLGWLTCLFPLLAKALSPYILLPGIVGEGSLTVWLLVKGVNDQRWKERSF